MFIATYPEYPLFLPPFFPPFYQSKALLSSITTCPRLHCIKLDQNWCPGFVNPLRSSRGSLYLCRLWDRPPVVRYRVPRGAPFGFGHTDSLKTALLKTQLNKEFFFSCSPDSCCSDYHWELCLLLHPSPSPPPRWPFPQWLAAR